MEIIFQRSKGSRQAICYGLLCIPNDVQTYYKIGYKEGVFLCVILHSQKLSDRQEIIKSS